MRRFITYLDSSNAVEELFPSRMRSIRSKIYSPATGLQVVFVTIPASLFLDIAPLYPIQVQIGRLPGIHSCLRADWHSQAYSEARLSELWAILLNDSVPGLSAEIKPVEATHSTPQEHTTPQETLAADEFMEYSYLEELLDEINRLGARMQAAADQMLIRIEGTEQDLQGIHNLVSAARVGLANG